MEDYNLKFDRREKKRLTKKKAWIKHNTGEWGKVHGTNATKFQKKMLKKKK